MDSGGCRGSCLWLVVGVGVCVAFSAAQQGGLIPDDPDKLYPFIAAAVAWLALVVGVLADALFLAVMIAITRASTAPPAPVPTLPPQFPLLLCIPGALYLPHGIANKAIAVAGVVAYHFVCQVGLPNLYGDRLNGQSALHRCVRFGGVGRARALLVHGADAFYRDCRGWTPLALAAHLSSWARLKDPAVLPLLHECSREPRWPEIEGVRCRNEGVARRCAIITALHPQRRDQLADVSADFATLPLHSRALTRDWLLWQDAAEDGASVAGDERDSDGWTPLHEAAFVRAAWTVGSIGRNVDVNAPDNQGWTPLHVAAFSGYGNIVRVLLRLGADPSAQDEHGHTPRDLALARGYPKVARMLRPK